MQPKNKLTKVNGIPVPHVFNYSTAEQKLSEGYVKKITDYRDFIIKVMTKSGIVFPDEVLHIGGPFRIGPRNSNDYYFDNPSSKEERSLMLRITILSGSLCKFELCEYYSNSIARKEGRGYQMKHRDKQSNESLFLLEKDNRYLALRELNYLIENISEFFKVEMKVPILTEQTVS